MGQMDGSADGSPLNSACAWGANSLKNPQESYIAFRQPAFLPAAFPLGSYGRRWMDWWMSVRKILLVICMHLPFC